MLTMICDINDDNKFNLVLFRSDGTTSFVVELPDSVMQYKVTGFAFDDLGHVGFVGQPLQVSCTENISK